MFAILPPDAVEPFCSAYRAALARDNLDVTVSVSTVEAVMLDQQISKNQNGTLQLQVYQKPLSAYLYIPAHSAHQEHIQRGWIRGELIRYVKRSSKQHLYLATRAKFWHRLCARGFTAQFLTEIFQKVSYDSRRSYLNRDKQRADCRMGTTKIAQNGNTPQLLALTMPSTQRSRAMKVPAALFSVVQRWTTEKLNMPESIRKAVFKTAWANTGKLDSLLITYKFPKTDTRL
eukprot:SAG31_NODE_794_length_12043_cov_7.416192_1_plen_231_part_00